MRSMETPYTTHQKAVSISSGVFLICLAILAYTNTWWPGILAAIGVSLAIKEALRGRIYDMLQSLFIFGGLFVVFYFMADWAVLVPVLFTIAGIWIITRELLTREKKVGKEATHEAVLEEKENEGK